MNKYVIAKIPRTGLGNKFFIWAHAVIHAQLNDKKLLVSSIAHISIGTFLRNERSKRLYFNCFKQNYSDIFFAFLKYKTSSKASLIPTECDQIREEKKLVVFSNQPHWTDYFYGIREYRELIINSLKNNLIQKKIFETIDSQEAPHIGVHIRMGDFKTLKAGEDFSKAGQTRTPFTYFIDTINNIRSFSGKNIPVTVFSDGYESELKDILSISNVSLASKHNLDIEDMMLLSKSKLIILSNGSTFGYWSGYLGDAILIHHYDHFHSYIRNKEFNKNSYEGVAKPNLNDWDEGLKKAISKSFNSIGH